MFHGVKMCSLLISQRESLHRLIITAWKSSLICRNMMSFTPRVKNSRMEWTSVEFEIHAVKTLIYTPWLWKKFTVFSEIHKPPFAWRVTNFRQYDKHHNMSNTSPLELKQISYYSLKLQFPMSVQEIILIFSHHFTNQYLSLMLWKTNTLTNVQIK